MERNQSPYRQQQRHQRPSTEAAVAIKDKSNSLPNYSRLNGGAATARNALYVAEFPSENAASTASAKGSTGSKERSRRSFSFFRKSSGRRKESDGASSDSTSASTESLSDGSPPVITSAPLAKSPRVKTGGASSGSGRGLLGQLAKRCSQRRAPSAEKSEVRNGGGSHDADATKRRNGVDGQSSKSTVTDTPSSNGTGSQPHLYEEVRRDARPSSTRGSLTAKLDSLFAACARTPGGNRQLADSLDNLSSSGTGTGSSSRKKRKEAAKARVEAQRRAAAASSSTSDSDDDHGGFRCNRKFHSEESLDQASTREKRARLARTERFYKRKAKDDELNGKPEQDRPPRGGSRDRNTITPADPTATTRPVGHFRSASPSTPAPSHQQTTRGRQPRDLAPSTQIDTVIKCQLPIGKPRGPNTVNGNQVSSSVARAPTPPPRSAKYFGSPPPTSAPPPPPHQPSTNGRKTAVTNQRPQSYAFETLHRGYVPPNRTNGRINGSDNTDIYYEPKPTTTSASNRLLRVPYAAPPTTNSGRQSRSGRPLSFTATSSVTYTQVSSQSPVSFQQLPIDGDRVTSSRAPLAVVDARSTRHASPDSYRYMSDSQLSSRHSNCSSRRASSVHDNCSEDSDSRQRNHYENHHHQDQQQSRNFNMVPKPWNYLISPVPLDNNDARRNATANRPPISPLQSPGATIARIPCSSSRSSKEQPAEKCSQLASSSAVLRLRSNGGLVDSVSGSSSSSNSRSNLSSLPLAPAPPTRKHYRQTTSHSANLEAAVGERLDKMLLQQRRRGAGALAPTSERVKRSSDNLEDALLELEKIYQSMKIDDDDYTNAENRLVANRRRNSTAGDLSAHWSETGAAFPRLTKTSSKGSFDSLITGGSGLQDEHLEEAGSSAVRRRLLVSGGGNNAVPDKVTDDLAYRKLSRLSVTDGTSRPSSAHLSGSYLLRSPALSPSVSIDDLRHGKHSEKMQRDVSEPDTVLDDLSFRAYRDANLQQRIVEPQPPFGIPVGPVSQAAASDYLHARAADLSRPKMRRRFTPDVVKDDLAYRNLRRELKPPPTPGGVESVSSSSSTTLTSTSPPAAPAPPSGIEHLDFDELDSIIKNGLPAAVTEAEVASRRKFRAARSLSANLSYIKCKHGPIELSRAPSAGDKDDSGQAETSSVMSDLRNVTDVKSGPDNRIVEPTLPTTSDVTTGSPRRSLGLDTSSSTETLTEKLSPVPGPPSPRTLPAPDPPARRPNSSANAPTTPIEGEPGEIWQVRVTLGAPGSSKTQTPDPVTVARPPVTLDDRRPDPGRLVRPIPVKLEVGRPASPCRHPAKRRPLPLSLQRLGYVSDPDVLATSVKGSPIDEGHLDDLLSSLAAAPASQRPGLSVSCPQSPMDGPGGPRFPGAVVTDVGQAGEMSVKFVLTGMKPNNVNAVEGTRLSSGSNDSTSTASLRCFNISPSVSYGVAGGRTRNADKFSAITRTSLGQIGTGAASTHGLTTNSSNHSNWSAMPGADSSIFGRSRSGGGTEADDDHDTNDATTLDPANRVARYKEERRRQLATQFGQWSSEAENGVGGVLSATGVDCSPLGAEPSYMRYSRRYKKNGAVNGVAAASCDDTMRGASESMAGSNDGGSTASAETTTLLPPTAMTDSAFRTNRASRLRAIANGTNGLDVASQNSESNRSGSFRSRLPVGSTRAASRDLTSSIPKNTSPADARTLDGDAESPVAATTFYFGGGAGVGTGGGSSSGGGSRPNDVSPPYTTESESGGTASDGQTRVKDKSSKRKSHLNRMGALEQPPVPSDSQDEVPRRSRRCSRQTSCDSAPSADGANSDTLKSLAIVRSAQHHITTQQVENAAEAKNNTCSVHVTGHQQSATIDNGERHQTTTNNNAAAADSSDSEFVGSARRSTGKAAVVATAALQRPEIPHIFRAKCSVQSATYTNNQHDDARLSEATISTATPNNQAQVHAFPVGKSSANIVTAPDSRRQYQFDQHGSHHVSTRISASSAFSPQTPGGTTRHDVGNGKASRAIEELAQLVRETTAQVDSLTDVARNVESRSGATLSGLLITNGATMGSLLSRGRTSPSTMDFEAEESSLETPQEEKPNAFFSQVTVSTRVNDDTRTTTTTTLEPLSLEISGDEQSSPEQMSPEPPSPGPLSPADKYLQRSGSFYYDRDGNWQLGPSSAAPTTNGSHDGLAGLLLPRLPLPGSSSKFVVNSDRDPPLDAPTTDDSIRLTKYSPTVVERWAMPNYSSSTVGKNGGWPNNSPPSSVGLWRKVTLPAEVAASDTASVDGGTNLGLVTRFEVSPIAAVDSAAPQRRNSANNATIDSSPRRISLNRSAFRSADQHDEVPYDSTTHKPTVINSESTTTTTTGILKKKSFDEGEIATRSILRFKEEVRTVDGRPPAIPHSILKRGSLDEGGARSRSPDTNNTSPHHLSTILKKRASSEDSDHRCSSPEVTSILRRRQSAPADEQADDADHASGDQREHPSILRRKSAPSYDMDGLRRSPELHHHHSILKKQCSGSSDPPSILKKRGSSEDLDVSSGASGGGSFETSAPATPKPILKKRSSAEDDLFLPEERPPRPILKTQRRRSGQEEDAAIGESLSAFEYDSRGSFRPSSTYGVVRTSSPVPALATRQCEVAERPRQSRGGGSSSDDDEFVSMSSSSPDTPRTRRLSAEDERLSNWKMIREQRSGSVCSQGSGSGERNMRQSTPPASETQPVHQGCDTTAVAGDQDNLTAIRDFFLDTDARSVAVAELSGVSENDHLAAATKCSSTQAADDARQQSSEIVSATRLRREKWLCKRKELEPERYRTQPVTFGELEETERLQSEQFFHHLATVKASVDRTQHSDHTKHSDDQQHHHDSLGQLPEDREVVTSPSKPPQPTSRFTTTTTSRSSPVRSPAPVTPRKGRRQTLPVSLDELVDAVQLRSTANRGDSEPADTQDDDDEGVLKLSVAARAQLFMQKQQLAQFQSSARSPATVRRFANRRGLQRSQTQPVTVEEVHEATKMNEDSANERRVADAELAGHVSPPSTPPPSSLPPGIDEATGKATPDSEEDPSKLSLADRVKLFNQKMVEVRLPTRRTSQTDEDAANSVAENGGGPPRRRRLVTSTRFCTQPITSEEVEMAHRIGPNGVSVAGLVRSQTCVAERDFGPSAAPGTLRITLGPMASTTTETTTNNRKGITKTKTVGSLASALESRLMAPNPGSRGGAFSYLSASGPTGAIKTGSILKSDRSPPAVRSPSADQQQAEADDSSSDDDTSSSSSSSDGEEETEGITISVRGDSSTQVTSRVTSSSSGSASESAVRETRRIKNEAVQRRRNAGLRKIEERKSTSTELQHSQSLNFTSSSFTCKSSSITSSVLSGSLIQQRNAQALRSPTQPITHMEREEAPNGVVQEVRGSIAERLAALQQSQQQDWKRRLARVKSDEGGDGDVKNTSDSTDSPGDGTGDESPSKILEKVSLLEVSQQCWKQRVVEKDASKFTVAGKMGKPSTPTTEESPRTERKKRTPRPVRFQSKTANLLELSKASSHSVDGLPPKAAAIVRSKSMPMPDSISDSSDEAKSPTKVSIPRLDDAGFCSFFESVDFDQMQSQRVTVEDDAFNQISAESRQLLVHKRTVQVSRKHVTTRNPLRALAAREDLQAEYTEVKSGIAEMELKRLKVEQLAKTSDLATSALAGLASTEDFKSVSLRKSASMLSSPLLPYKDNMLIQVKGRRHIQCRLVEPAVTSLNKGDNFVIVTPSEVYNWIGEFSNVIERAKAADMTLTIQSKKDLGFKGAGEVITLDEEKQTVGRGKWRDFYQLLGGQDDISEAGIPEEDEVYEAAIIETNKVYDVVDNALVPIEKYWGGLPRIEMLEPKKVIVFDFGSEMYVWQGKLVPNDMRRRAIRLARELWDEGYDYVECDINPIHPHQQNKLRSGKPRPPWALFAKINQHMETVLFRSKFLDWPDMERIIKIKRQDSESKSDGSLDLQPCNAQQMLDVMLDEPDIVLENSHLGRGLSYWDAEERRHSEVATLAIKVWHVLEYNHSILPLESLGQFHRGDTYVVRWQYRLTVGGRDLLGNISKHSCQGRERCAYFFWQGQHSTINEKGASALLTVELDEERGPQVRVVQGQEPPSFLNLFKGSMIVHFGKKGEEVNRDAWRLFMVRGEFENEAHLVEVQCNSAALRSRGAYVLIHPANAQVFRWCGANVSDHLKEASLAAVEILEARRPAEIGFPIGSEVIVEDVSEGEESEEFWDGLGGERIPSEDSNFSNDGASLRPTPRLFHFSSVSGVFLSAELACSFRSKERASAYPFTQTELYKVTQPALFLFDNHHEVYLWQGWWPEATEDNDNLATGSAHLRWNVERRLAMDTALEYCKNKSPDSPIASYLVWAGLEPQRFKNLFPEWETHSDVAKLNMAIGVRDGELKRMEDVLLQLKRNRYTFAELQERPLPEGVDPTILESYLCKDEFEEVLKMSKKEFYSLPSWKQSNLKKTAGLFY